MSDRLREYRAHLIADVITGKLDVRGLAATLPEPFGEFEIEDESDIAEIAIEVDESDEEAA